MEFRSLLSFSFWEKQPHKVFLLDGIGAIVSAVLLFGLVGTFEGFFGMPREIIIPLTIIPVLYAIYSFSCFLLLKQRFSRFLKIIGIANLSYCMLTGYFVWMYFPQLSIWAILYFLSETLIVVSIAVFEFKVAATLQHSKS